MGLLLEQLGWRFWAVGYQVHVRSPPAQWFVCERLTLGGRGSAQGSNRRNDTLFWEKKKKEREEERERDAYLSTSFFLLLSFFPLFPSLFFLQAAPDSLFILSLVTQRPDTDRLRSWSCLVQEASYDLFTQCLESIHILAPFLPSGPLVDYNFRL